MAQPKQVSVIDAILQHSKKFGVTIIIDADDRSDAVRMGLPFTWQKRDKILQIFVCNLKDDEQEKLLPIIREYFDKHGLILNTTQDNDLEEYSSYVNNNPYQYVLDFFKDKISSNDHDALKMALFMRREKELGRDIERYKKDIRDSFGQRGAYIGNLCSAGYFENDFIPAYNNMTPDEFDKYYKQSVGEEAIALFVHLGMTASVMKKVIEEKIEKCLKYQRDSFRILGFGGKNVAFIKEFLSQNPDNSWGVDLTIRVREGHDSQTEIEFDVAIQN